MMWWKSGAAGAFPAASCALDIRLPVSELVFRFAIGDSEPEGDLWSWIHILDLAMLVKFTWCIDKRLLSLARLSREDVVFPRVRHLVLRIQNSLVLTHSGIEQLPRTFPGLEQLCVQVIDGPYNTEMACERASLCASVFLPCTPFVNKLKIWNEAAGRLLFTLQRIERYIPPTITNVALQSDNGNYSLWSGILAFFPNLRTLDFRVKESSGDSRPSEAPHFLASLSTILPPTLESLRVHIWSSRAVLPGGQTGRVGLSRLPSADELQAELLKGSRDGLRRSIWRGLSNPSLFAGESDTQGGGLYWAETSGVKSAADGPDGKQQGTTGGDKSLRVFKFFTVYCPPPTALRLPPDTTGPFADAAIDSHSTPLHLPPCPLQSPSSTQSDALPPVGPQRSARAALLSRRLAHPRRLRRRRQSVKDIMQAAFENGINMFDTAEDYQKGAAERKWDTLSKNLAGAARTSSSQPRYSGATSQARARTTRGCRTNTLSRARRLVCDGSRWTMSTSSSRIVAIPPFRWRRSSGAFNYVIDQGWAFYWGTSEWSAPDRGGASCCHALKPHRARSRSSASTTCSTANVRRRNTRGVGNHQTSAVANADFVALWRTADGEVQRRHPRRHAPPPCPCSAGATEGPQGEELLWKVRLLSQIAAGASFLPDLLNSGRNRWRLAWVAAHRHTSTVILGVSSVAQLEANLGALEVLPKLDAAVLARIEAVLGNHPQEPETYGRPPLDQGIL
ncbi:Aldo-ket-red domain-containing protein [Mycena indigotica]|uniref:Aldo-ket-red domain-containing protein n=1 Tax=Mycena indigotica TaxID=2126181 RepID=A0A8H6VQP1_9AGAR|nr:Aldo-ket-red domain-containing protein [Mycena indigotica]KAF7288496.1 Aldo-ket-red domain-containing protein [Mycena indigotica]